MCRNPIVCIRIQVIQIKFCFKSLISQSLPNFKGQFSQKRKLVVTTILHWTSDIRIAHKIIFVFCDFFFLTISLSFRKIIIFPSFPFQLASISFLKNFVRTDDDMFKNATVLQRCYDVLSFIRRLLRLHTRWMCQGQTTPAIVPLPDSLTQCTTGLKMKELFSTTLGFLLLLLFGNFCCCFIGNFHNAPFSCFSTLFFLLNKHNFHNILKENNRPL